MKKMTLAFAAVLVLSTILALPAAAQVNPVWTAVASTGAIDESAAAIYAVNGATLGYLAGSPSLAKIVARYNVTNLDGTNNPLWSNLQLGFFDSSPASSVTATLFQVDPCSGAVTTICTAVSFDSTTNNCSRCTFSQQLDFTRFTYFVEVSLSRTASTVLPQAIALRIF